MRLRIAFVALALACATTTSAPPVFEFHNNFWLNLHNFTRVVARGLPVKPDLTPEERESWDSAVAFYRERYAQRDLVFDDGMVEIKNALRAFEGKDSIADAPIDPELRATLMRIAPVYRRVWWPKHERENRAWIEAASALTTQYARPLSARVAAAYGQTWPNEPIPVDLASTAGAVGAYTTRNPTHTTIAATDPGYQGLAALEMVFHEASHQWGLVLQQSIRRASESRHKKVPPQLWHAVLFYNAGELTRRTLAEHGVTYVEQAVKGNLYRDLCGEGCRERVTAAWDRRLNGTATVDEAIDSLVASWPDQ